MLTEPCRFYVSCLFIVAVFCAEVSAQSGSFLSVQEFQRRAFPTVEAQAGTLWLGPEQKKVAKQIINHDYARLRVRYWFHQQRSAWVLDEIGKEQAITLGVVVENQRIVDVMVLEYRESRGGDIRHGFFTKQFQGLGLRGDQEKPTLDGNIDGITGATLSVRATKKIATLALFFHRQVLMNEAAGGQFQAQH